VGGAGNGVVEHRAGNIVIGIDLDQMAGVALFSKQVERAIGGAGVDREEFKIAEGLPRQHIEYGADMRDLVFRPHDDGDRDAHGGVGRSSNQGSFSSAWGAKDLMHLTSSVRTRIGLRNTCSGRMPSAWSFSDRL